MSFHLISRRDLTLSRPSFESPTNSKLSCSILRRSLPLPQTFPTPIPLIYRPSFAPETDSDCRHSRRFRSPLSAAVPICFGVGQHILSVPFPNVKRYVVPARFASFFFTWSHTLCSQLSHFSTEIEGLNVHFLHVSYPPQPSERRYPLLLIHGYPGSFWDFYKVTPILGNPSRFGFEFGANGRISFDLVVPSVPGFGFSDKPAKPGVFLVG